MKTGIAFVIVTTILVSCGIKKSGDTSEHIVLPIVGTWKLLSGTTIEKGETVVTDYTKKLSFIKILNETHFAFLEHDLNKGKDSSATFVSGGGSYSLADNVYTEHLKYCSAREWEGNDFKFTITIKNDTLIQSGIEKVENTGINRLNIEKYTRVKD